VDAAQFLGLVRATVKNTKTVTVALDATILGGVKNFDTSKPYTFFVNAITVGDGVGEEIVLNKSAQGKFAVKKNAVTAAQLTDWASERCCHSEEYSDYTGRNVGYLDVGCG